MNMEDEKSMGCDQIMQNSWGTVTDSQQLTYSNFDQLDFEIKLSIILNYGGIVSIVHQDDFIVFLYLINGFYVELFIDPKSYLVMYMEIPNVFSLIKHAKESMVKNSTSFLN
jgi:hypothetical protein